MPKKLAKKFVKQTFELPGGVTRKAAEQAGVVPSREERPEMREEELEEKRKKDEAMSRKLKVQLEAELKQEVEKGKAARAQAQQAEELKKKEEVPEEPLKEPETKRPRKLLAGLRARWRKVRPEWAGGRAGG